MERFVCFVLKLTTLLRVVKRQFSSDEEQDSLEEEDSDSETEDENGDELDPAKDVAFLKTLALIQKKDPSIYDTTKSLFEGPCRVKKPGCGNLTRPRAGEAGLLGFPQCTTRQEGEGMSEPRRLLNYPLNRFRSSNRPRNLSHTSPNWLPPCWIPLTPSKHLDH